MTQVSELQASLIAQFRPAHTQVTLNNIALNFVYLESSIQGFREILQEIQNDEYGLEQIWFRPGDIVLDVGANVGVISIYLAKKFPFVKIYSFEPVPLNYEHFIQNIAINGVTNVIPHPLALTKDGRRLTIDMHPSCTGGSSANSRFEDLAKCVRYHVNSVTLDNVLEDNRIESCRLLKIDCEGSEFEVLHNSQLLNRVEYLSGEFHINQKLREQGYSLEALFEYCRRFVAPDKIKVRAIRMCE